METRDPMHLETEPATASTATSQAYKNGEPGLHSFQSDPIHHNELMHYEGSGYGHNPVLYRPVSVFPHPAGYTSSMPQFYTSRGMANATTVMPDQAQFNLIQRQLLYGNPISIGHNLPVVYHSQGQSIGVPAGYNLIPNAVQTGYLYHQEQLFGSLHPWNTNYRFPGHGVVHNAASSHQNLVGVSLNSSYVHGWPGMNINPGMMHGTNPRANSTPSNLPVLQCHSRQHFPVPVGRALGLEYHLGARLNEDSNRCIQDPTTGSRPLSHSHGGLSPMDLARFSRVGLTNTSLSRIPNEQNSFELQHAHENIIRMLPTEPSAVLPTVWARQSTNMENPSGEHSQAQRNQLDHFNQTSVPPVRRNTKQTASASGQVSWKKTWTWPSNRIHKPSKGNVYHISWDGFEKSYLPVGLKCNFCNGDLGYAPVKIESKPPVLPEVSVLSCGHAFHSECFQPLIQEPSADPPCCICALGKP